MLLCFPIMCIRVHSGPSTSQDIAGTSMCPSPFRIFTRCYCDLGDNISSTSELVNFVADSRCKLYDDFLHADGRRLAEYFGAVLVRRVGSVQGRINVATKRALGGG